jgi:hypothetical protein
MGEEGEHELKLKATLGPILKSEQARSLIEKGEDAASGSHL